MKKFLKELLSSTVLQFITSSVLIIFFAIIYNIATYDTIIYDIGYYGFLISFTPLVFIFIRAMYYAVKNTIKDINE